MTLDEYLIDVLAVMYFEEPYFWFWTSTVLEAMTLLGQNTDDDLNRLCDVLITYYTTDEISDDAVKNIRREIVRLMGAGFWRDVSPLGLKYRCLNAISSTMEDNQKDTYYWKYGIVTAFQLINLDNNKDTVLIARIQNGLSNRKD